MKKRSWRHAPGDILSAGPWMGPFIVGNDLSAAAVAKDEVHTRFGYGFREPFHDLPRCS